MGADVSHYRTVTGRLLDAAPLALLCLIPVLLYLPFMGAPFERDEGVYATIAQGLLDGRIPYRDLFDNKPPLVYGWYAFSFMLFGEDVFAPRILAAVVLSLTTLSIFAEARLLFPRGLAYLATGLFALSTGLPFVSLHANTEAYMVLPLVTSLVAFTVGMRGGRLRWFLLAGALGGLAMMTKQVAVWNLLALAVVALVWRWRAIGRSWHSVTPALCLLAGAAATTGLVALPLVVTGVLDEFFYANISYNWLYVGAPTLAKRLQEAQAALLFLALAAPLVGGALVGLFVIWRRRTRAGAFLLLVWALGSAAGVASGSRFFPHYFLHLLPAMALLTAVVVYERLRGDSVRPVPKWALLVGVMLVAVSIVTNAALYIAPGAAEQRVYEPVYEQKQWEIASKPLAAYIAQRTDPEEAIFNFGRESQLYFYAQRRPAVRYFYDWAYEYDEKTLGETMDALRKAKPVYIIDSLQPPLFEDYDRYHPPEYQEFLSENYEYVGKVYFAQVYRLKGHP